MERGPRLSFVRREQDGREINLALARPPDSHDLVAAGDPATAAGDPATAGSYPAAGDPAAHGGLPRRPNGRTPTRGSRR